MKSAIVRLCRVLVIAFACAALPAVAMAQQPAAAAASPSPAKKTHAPTFRGNIDSADATAKTITIKNTKTTHTIKLTATTNLLKRSGGNATFDDLKAGEYVTGSGKKTGENEIEATLVKVGPKLDAAAPGATPAAKKSHGKKAAAAAASPSPSPAAQ